MHFKRSNWIFNVEKVSRRSCCFPLHVPAVIRANDTNISMLQRRFRTNIISFLDFWGGRERWDSPREGVRKLALELRALKLPAVHIETVENVRRELALRLVHNALDKNRDGRLQVVEKKSARLILYGQSFGGAAVVKFATQLKDQNIPVLLTIQIDSVGRDDDVIPENVRFASNLFQRNGRFIRGEPEIRAENNAKTTILGNQEFNYRHKQIDLRSIPWWKKIFRVAHTKMNLDPEVWLKIK